LADRPEMGHAMNFMRVLTVLTIYFVGTLPSVRSTFVTCTQLSITQGVLVTLIAGVASTAMQTAAMQYKPLRRALNIPAIPPTMRGRLPTFRESFRAMVNWFGNQKLEAQTRNHSLRKK
jgi:YidC/Oxa1 family membrane protein insertase